MPNEQRLELRGLLTSLAQLDAETMASKAGELAFAVRDCRIELRRSAPCELSDAQVHRLQQLEYRLEMLASGHGLAEGVGSEAERSLNAFGWTIN